MSARTMRRLGIGLLWAVPAYVAGAVGGGILINLLSPNDQDRSLEAAMTGAFVIGPLMAVVGFLAGLAFAARLGRRSSAPPPVP